ncbi:cAMP-binding domain of CRP or a regulatory subunit of cAMP-dependent protein kinases [Chitinophaga sp. YR627]|uniref:Crp/Fnr family transcriptional regulator n=1 Tax=Chitinophaga sp. YR627 TaxID=1881041 RepID=UPI0008E8AC90|nr:Crp/Fnr family transcriptional regulator [Chitinophaga sp. YR627]SFN02502.1 cAMP-binding domain of CRP or a regulatory subunit of cAMP-dependent protein kinases [Chitinophaga sp. YR627]
MRATPGLTDFHQQIIDHVQQRIRLTSAEQERFVGLLHFRRLLPRQYLLQQGEVCRYENYVCSGFLRSFYTDEAGVDHTLHFAMEDWWISNSTSFISQQASRINIVALEPCAILQIDKTGLDQLFDDVPAFERFWRILNQQALISQDQRILNNISMSGAERYEALITKYPNLEQRLPQKFIASFLGITPVFLSQIRKNYKR